MSIKEIAEKAGVSIATVSRVLNDPNYHCAKEGMRERIWQIAMEMNYTPNESARNLKMKKSTGEMALFQILMTRAGAESENDPFFRELLRYVEAEITSHHCILTNIQYRAELSNDKKCHAMNRAAEVEKMRAAAGERCSGIVIIGKCNREILKEIHRQYKNVVTINRNSSEYEVDEVLCDGRKVAALAVNHLIGLGHRRIGYVGNCRNESRYRGYQDVLRTENLDLIPDYVIETDQTEREGYLAMQKFLRQADMPTAFYCANDLTAIGMLRYLNERRHLPFTPSIIASDDIEAAQNCDPMLTTVALPKQEMARFAIYLLLDRIRGGHSGITRIEVEGKLLHRNSCYACTERISS